MSFENNERKQRFLRTFEAIVDTIASIRANRKKLNERIVDGEKEILPREPKVIEEGGGAESIG